MDDFDSLLGDIGTEDAVPVEAPQGDLKEKTEETFPVGDNSPTPPDLSQKSWIPEIVGGDCPVEYMNIVERIQYQYSCLPELHYNEIYEELSDLSIKSHPSPTLQMINDEIQKIQAAKERLSEIFREVERNFFIKKRSVDILESAWAKYTVEKSADKRKGDAIIKVSNFISDYALTEACYKVCQHIIKTLDSSHESLSRRITVNVSLLKMNDYGRRGVSDDYDYASQKREADNDNDSGDKENLEEENF